MAIAKMTLQGAYGYFHGIGEDLFTYLVLPSGMSKETFTDTLFLDYGERAILYTDIDMFRRMIGAWSSKWALELGRIAKTLTDDYEPLWNIDRYEKVHDDTTDEIDDTATENVDVDLTSNVGNTHSQDVENKTSAYNSSTYQPDNTSAISGSNTEATSQSTESDKSNTYSRDYDRNYDHDGHYYGNGGITTSQSMAIEEVRLRETYNLYHEAAKLFADDLLLYIY